MGEATTIEGLRELIRRNMEGEWLDKEPSPRCFDHPSGTNMEALWDFIEGGRDPGHVRAHLIECCRCRYVYAVTREAPRASRS